MLREKWTAMTAFQRGCLLVQAAAVLLFALLYFAAGSREGTEYCGDFYRRTLQGDTVVYTGKRGGLKTVYMVRPAGEGYTVEYEIDGQNFGPYDILPAPEAAGDVGDWEGPVTGGVEVRQGDRSLYRGAYYASREGSLLWMKDMNAVYIGGGVSQMRFSSVPAYAGEPEAEDLLYFAMKPPITHRGDWRFYWLGVFLAVLNAAGILFAEELFVWHMHWHINDPEEATPSDWELFSRYFGWGLLIVVSLFCFANGLSTIV